MYESWRHTGTALTEADEFLDIYNLEVLEVRPTSRWCASTTTTRSIAAAEVRAILGDRRVQGRARLVRWHTSIEKSATGEMLRQQGWEQHDFADLRLRRSIRATTAPPRRRCSPSSMPATTSRRPTSSGSGVPGAVIATNMAGRGTDIQLGGNADMCIRQELAEIEDARARRPRAEEIRTQVARLKEKALVAGGLFAGHRAAREPAHRQRCAAARRQGDPGHQFFLSLERPDAASSGPTSWTPCCSGGLKENGRSFIPGSTRRWRKRTD
jgi:preprotein translocase subunit SecA